VGLHEMKGSRFRVDQAHWTSLIDWIEHGIVPAGETPWAEVATTDTTAENAGDEPVAEAVVEAAAEPAPQTQTEPPLRLFNVSAFIKRDT
jgi:hypothetical protein